MFSAPDYSFGWLLPRSALKQLGKIDHWRIFASRFSFFCLVLKLFPLLGHISWNHLRLIVLGKHHNCKWFIFIIALSHWLCENSVFYHCQYQFHIMISPNALPDWFCWLQKAKRTQGLSALIRETAFNSYQKLIKNHKLITIQPQNPSQTSASKAWPNLSLKVLAKLSTKRSSASISAILTTSRSL